MIKNYKFSTIGQINKFYNLATKANFDIGVHDHSGLIAEAKSFLGLFMLDFSQPVKIVVEDNCEKELIKFMKKMES